MDVSEVAKKDEDSVVGPVGGQGGADDLVQCRRIGIPGRFGGHGRDRGA